MIAIEGHKTGLLLRSAADWHLDAIVLLSFLVLLTFHHCLPYVLSSSGPSHPLPVIAYSLSHYLPFPSIP
ncbi:hypothetical protein ASPTUDRAFT_37257, partial [Aspergillus tubingensis CBS 134.48]